MAYKLIWSLTARDDLHDIIIFIARHSPERAMSFGYELIAMTDQLQLFPEHGRIVPEYPNPELREIIFRPYRVVYRINHERKQCEIARVLALSTRHSSFIRDEPLFMNSSEIRIEVVSRLEAGEILCSPDLCAEVTYLVSIGDADDALPSGYDNIDHKLRLLIADVVTEEGATEEDVQRIIQLAEQLQTDYGKVLIHCEAGVSRSTATALIIYACWLGPGHEHEAMERVIAQRPYAIPNRRMVRLADNLLQLGGRLVQARDDLSIRL